MSLGSTARKPTKGPAYLSPLKHFPTPFASKSTGRAAFIVTERSGSPTRHTSKGSLSPLSGSPTSSLFDRPWDRSGPTPLPSPNIFPPESHKDGLFPMQNQKTVLPESQKGLPSPALSTGSKTDLFFLSNTASALPSPPKPLVKPGLLGRGHPNGGIKGHDRASSLPMPRLEEIKGHGRTPSDGLSGIIVTIPTPSSPSAGSLGGIPHRSISYPSQSLNRIASGWIPVTPLSTLPTFPEVASKAKQPIQREKHDTPIDEPPLKSGDVLAPSPNEDAHGDGSWRIESKFGEGAFSSVWSASPLVSSVKTSLPHKTVAIKLMSKRLCSTNARTKIAFIREVEVLRHIFHPSIVAFIASFSTAAYYCLVLERVEGGELFELLSVDENRRSMILSGPGDPTGQGFVRRVFSELIKAVGWLHEVGVAHRDIKLESESNSVDSILLASQESHDTAREKVC